MADILKLLDSGTPLQKRYDNFLNWDNQNACTVFNLIADKLEIPVAAVEIFYEFGKLDTEEFGLIDKNKITIDALFFIVKEDKQKRLNIYENYSKIVSGTSQPIKAIKEFIDNDSTIDFRSMLQTVSPEAYYVISKYLKDMKIRKGTITNKFGGFIKKIGLTIKNGKEISEPQSDWIVRAITHDKTHSLNVFTNEILKKDFEKDYLIFNEISVFVESISK